MKHLKKFNERLIEYCKIRYLCKKYSIKNYTICSDRTIDVDGDVNLYRKNLTKLPLKFNKVSGTFYCNDTQLTTLEGSPKEVGGGFYCFNNQLTSLEGGPIKVGGEFYCSHNQLTSLEGGPKEVGGYFYCNDTQLTTLEGSPKEVGGGFHCYNNELTTMEGGPTKIGGNVYCDYNPLPDIILNNKYLKKILLEGDDFYIWKKGKLDMSSFNYMMDVFKDEE